MGLWQKFVNLAKGRTIHVRDREGGEHDIPIVDNREQIILSNYRAGGVELAHAAALGAIAIHDRLHGEKGAFLKEMGVSEAEWNALGDGNPKRQKELQATFVAANQWLGNDAKNLGHALFVTCKNGDLNFERMERDLQSSEKWGSASLPSKLVRVVDEMCDISRALAGKIGNKLHASQVSMDSTNTTLPSAPFSGRTAKSAEAELARK